MTDGCVVCVCESPGRVDWVRAACGWSWGKERGMEGYSRWGQEGLHTKLRTKAAVFSEMNREWNITTRGLMNIE